MVKLRTMIFTLCLHATINHKSLLLMGSADFKFVRLANGKFIGSKIAGSLETFSRLSTFM